MSTLFKFFTPSLIIQRTLKFKNYLWPGAIKYPGFLYYPRHENWEDPPYEPTKLFRVSRIKPLKGVPKFEKRILHDFKLDGKLYDYAIIKNIPEHNQRLWKIKHLIQIVPITYPDGFPKEDDKTYLKENGELRIIKKLEPFEKRLELLDKFRTEVKRMDGDTLRRKLRLKWLSGWD